MAALIKKKHFGYLYRLLIFLGAVAFILYIFPREGKFRFEYQKGRPWQHGILYAPFNFPVKKTEKELTAEKDSILKKHHPYYSVSEQIIQTTNDKVKQRLEREWPTFNMPDSLQEKYSTVISSVIKEVCESGIISFSELNRLQIEGRTDINIVNKEASKKESRENILTAKSAYTLINSRLKNNDSLPELLSIASKLDLNNYLTANLEFNDELTSKAKKDLIAQISLTSGLVETGERIIDNGQIIDDEVFKKLESFREAYETKLGTSDKRTIILAGQAIIIIVLLFTFYTFLYFYRIDIFENTKDFTFIILNILLFITITAVVKQFSTLSLYLIPYAILPVVLRTFFDSRTAIFANIITILLASFFAGNSFEFVLLQITVGMAAAFSLKELYNRGQLFRSSIFVFLSYCLIYFGLALVQGGSFDQVNYTYYLYFVINGLLMLFAYPLIYIFEKLFSYLSDVTLMELSDTNHPLLRRLSEKAPGTFQHSIMVSNLAQEAAIKIDANPLLARVGALYHDIGKSVQPIYFTENQSGSISPHKNMKPEDSAKVVIDHVKEGVKLANKHGLPKIITDFISTHHGLGKTKFFMIQDAKENPNKEIDETKYAYPGPNPFTKETAILMMADSVEAASRSLGEYTDETIGNLVEKIIESQLSDGNFRNAPITFKEIEIVKETFKEKLRNIYHTRIAYPKEALESKKETN